MTRPKRDPRQKALIAVLLAAAVCATALVARRASGVSGAASRKETSSARRVRSQSGKRQPELFARPPSIELIATRNLFQPRVSKPTPSRPQTPALGTNIALPSVLPMPVVAGLEPTAGLATESDWFYAGHAMLGDLSTSILANTAENGSVAPSSSAGPGASRIVAFVENRTTHEGMMLSVGDSFNGGVVKEIRPESLILAKGSGVETMGRTDTFSVTPLNEPPRQQTQTRPGRPGSAAGGPGRGWAAGGQAGWAIPDGAREFLRDFMRSPERREQMRSWMQRIGSDLNRMLNESEQQ